MTDNTFLSPPKVDRKHFKKNFLDQVVIELRFPTLLEIEEKKPTELQKVLRHSYPNYKRTMSTELTPAGSTNSVAYEFRDKSNKNWIKLSSSSISYNTVAYSSFEETIEQCQFMIETALPFLDTNFFTRIGMRYINKLPIENSINKVKDWLNEDLIKSVSTGVLGSVSSLKTEFRGNVNEDAKYLFRCGILDDANQRDDGKATFVLDYDYFQLDVEANNAVEVLNTFHDIHFRFFWWSLGENAKKELKDA